MGIAGSARLLPNKARPKRRGVRGAANSGGERLEAIPEPRKVESGKNAQIIFI